MSSHGADTSAAWLSGASPEVDFFNVLRIQFIDSLRLLSRARYGSFKSTVIFVTYEVDETDGGRGFGNA